MKTPSSIRIQSACTYFGGVGGGGAPNPNITPELKNIYGGFGSQTVPAYNSFISGNQLSSGANQLFGFAQQGITNFENPILQSGGALTPEQTRDIQQSTRSEFAARGNVMGNQAIGSELLNRQQFKDQRFQQALGDILGTGQAQVQALQGETSSFANLVNPIYGLFENAQNAATQLQIAQENKSAGIGAGGLSAIGSIAGGIGTAL